jgi:hypothetical protein
MAWALLLLNVCIVLLGAGLRYTPEARKYASPVAMPPQTWWWVLGCAAGLAVAAVVADRRRLARSVPRRAFAELALLFGCFFALLWGVVPAFRRRAVDWAIVASLGLAGSAAVVALLWSGRRRFRPQGLTGRNFLAACRRLAAPTAVMIAAPLLAAAWVGTDFQPRRAAAAFATYPFYALVQLVLFQVFLVPRLRRLTGSATAVVLVAAGTFALAHWPNGLLMAACGLAAMVWTAVYLASPNVYALALSMGLAASAFASVLPRQITHNLRTGPTYVQRAMEMDADGGR